MSKKKIDLSLVESELRQGSVFFRGRQSLKDNDTTPGSVKSDSEKLENERTREGVNVYAFTPVQAHTRDGSHLHTRSGVQVSRKQTTSDDLGKQSKSTQKTVRVGFNIFPYQVQALRKLEAERKLAFQDSSQSELAREAIEDLLKKYGAS